MVCVYLLPLADRRKDLARPEESWENVTYNVPRHIQDAVELENEDLLKWREKYDLALNRFVVEKTALRQI